MSPNGAYPDEMEEVTLFTDALRAAVPAGPSRALTTTIVPRLAAAARSATIEAETRASRRRARSLRSRRGLVAKVAVAVASVPLLLAGLAFAGVTVPGPARDAFESVGITLPNQPSAHSSATEATEQNDQGIGPTSAGNDVSDAAHTKAKGKGGNSAAAHQHARTQHQKAQGEAKGHSRGKAVGLNDLTPPGHSVRMGPPPQSHAGGNAGGNGGGNGGGYGGGSSAGHSTGQPPAPAPTPNGGARGQSETPPGQSKK